MRILAKTLAVIAALAPIPASAHCACHCHHAWEARGDWDHTRHTSYTRDDDDSSVAYSYARVLLRRPCHYPSSAARAEASGTTLVRVRIADNGRVEAARVYRSSGRGDLDRSALACVTGWRLRSGADWQVVRVVWRWHAAWG